MEESCIKDKNTKDRETDNQADCNQAADNQGVCNQGADNQIAENKNICGEIKANECGGSCEGCGASCDVGERKPGIFDRLESLSEHFSKIGEENIIQMLTETVAEWETEEDD